LVEWMLPMVSVVLLVVNSVLLVFEDLQAHGVACMLRKVRVGCTFSCMACATVRTGSSGDEDLLVFVGNVQGRCEGISCVEPCSQAVCTALHRTRVANVPITFSSSRL
jgi:hypothetical protein